MQWFEAANDHGVCTGSTAQLSCIARGAYTSASAVQWVECCSEQAHVTAIIILMALGISLNAAAAAAAIR